LTYTYTSTNKPIDPPYDDPPDCVTLHSYVIPSLWLQYVGEEFPLFVGEGAVHHQTPGVPLS